MRLIERDELLARLETCLDEASTSGRLVLLAGEAGVGKTSVVRAFAHTAAERVRVLWGACDPLSTPRPLAFSAILRKLGVGTRGEAAAAARKMGIRVAQT